MFILRCLDDQSFVLRDEREVIFEDGVKIGDKVAFFYGGKEWRGEVLDRSDDSSSLEKKLKAMVDADQKRRLGKEALKSCNENTPATDKRVSKTNKRYGSFDFSSPSTAFAAKKTKLPVEGPKAVKRNKKQETAQIQSAKSQQMKAIVNNYGNDQNTSDSDDDLDLSSDVEYDNLADSKMLQGNIRSSSPTKEELKQMLAEEKHKLQKISANNKSACVSLFTAGTASNSRQPGNSFASLSGGTSSKAVDHNAESHGASLSRDGKQAEKTGKTSTSGEKAIRIGGDKDSEDEDGEHADGEDADGEDANGENADDHGVEEPGRQLHQLYGKDWKEEKMVLLRDGVYVKESALVSALGGASKATHVVRRLFTGVFRTDAVANLSLTGRRSGGKASDVLDWKARDAIIKYAQNLASQMKWPKQKSSYLKRQLTQRIGEVKRDMKSRV